MGYILGLDMGITSVGWGIIEENTYNIIDYGVRLFEEANADNNLKRRTMRGSRRLKSRRHNRINAIKYYLIQLGIIKSMDFEPMNNVYELRVKGLHSKLSNIEFANVLVNIAKHRGSSLDVAVDLDNKDEATSASALSNNTKRLIKEGKYVCELQVERLENNGALRDSSNVFKTSDYEKELRQILSNQGLTDEQNEKIISVVVRRRNFSEGPGSENFPTKYGSYRIEEVDGVEVVKHVNLIDMMRGKCSIFKDELRIAKNTYEACLFNLLNDLNNIKYIDGDAETKLSIDDKKYIIDNYINKKGDITPKELSKYLNVDLEKISGFRLDTKGKPLLTSFDLYKKMKKNKINDDFLSNHDDFDSVVDILTKTQVVEERKDCINALNVKLSNEEIEMISNFAKVNGYHSLSKKAMDVIIPELLNTNKNQMQIITDNGLNVQHLDLSGKDIRFDDSAILSPVAARVHRQAIKVINALRKEYGEFASIVIETTRAKNSAEEKKNIQEQQKRYEQNKKQADELLLDLKKDPNDFNEQARLKLKLYNEQNGKTIYAGYPIDLNTLLNDENAYQIEHIIPYSISFDNSLNNKALASSKENQDKGKMTPFMYFKSGKVNGPIDTFEKFEAIVEQLYETKHISKQKMLNLLNQEDLTKFVNMEEFVARNLVDTSYGIRTVMNTLKAYYKANNIDTKVFTIKGKNTGAFRSRFGLSKDRDKYIHHAVDALIIAGFKNQKVFNQGLELNADDNGNIYDLNTGELIDLDNPFEDSVLIKYLKELRKIQGSPLDFSYALDTKTNRQFSDETIYSTRTYEGTEYVVKKFKDIYGKEGESLKKKFTENNSEQLLMFRNDKATYDLFKSIVDFYSNEKNPFAKYKEEHGPIKKVSKHDNGPEIYSVKYIDSKLGNHLDISKNYKTNGKKKVVLLQITPYRADVYQEPNGQYKFVTIRRSQIKIINGKNIIDSNDYLNMKKDKGISNDAVFLFSLNRNNIIRFVDKKNIIQDGNYGDKFLYRFKVVNSDDRNTIEIANIDCSGERTIVSVGKSIALLEKYNVSPTGKFFKVIKEDLKLEW